jgi:hypothetical protein
MKAPNMADGNDDDPLEQEYERNTLLEHICAGVLVVGLAAELVNAAIWFEGVKTIAEMFAISLIVLGVAGEVWFGNRARIAGDKQMAQYRARAAEADQKAQEAALELARLTTPRIIPLGQHKEIADSLRAFAGTRFDTAVALSDDEALTILEMIEAIVRAADWVQIDWREVPTIPGSMPIVLNRPGLPSIGNASIPGILIQFESDMQAALGPAATALATALVTAGVPARVGPNFVTNTAANTTAIHIFVGRKEHRRS